jgi:hypothetical protein
MESSTGAGASCSVAIPLGHEASTGRPGWRQTLVMRSQPSLAGMALVHVEATTTALWRTRLPGGPGQGHLGFIATPVTAMSLVSINQRF